MRLPKSPEEKRKTRAARQARYRARQKDKEVLTQHVEHSLGMDVPKPRRPLSPKVRSGDLATLVAQIAYEGVNSGDLDLTNKDHVPGITAGLKAQAILDSREKLKAKTGQTLELLAGLRAILSGDLPPRQLEDGNTLEGEYADVSPE